MSASPKAAATSGGKAEAMVTIREPSAGRGWASGGARVTSRSAANGRPRSAAGASSHSTIVQSAAPAARPARGGRRRHSASIPRPASTAAASASNRHRPVRDPGRLQPPRRRRREQNRSGENASPRTAMATGSGRETGSRQKQRRNANEGASRHDRLAAGGERARRGGRCCPAPGCAPGRRRPVTGGGAFVGCGRSGLAADVCQPRRRQSDERCQRQRRDHRDRPAAGGTGRRHGRARARARPR